MKKAVLIIVSCVVVIAAGLTFLYFRMMSLMPVSSTGMVTPGVYALKDSFVNAYLITDGTNTIAIDSGLNTNNLAAQMKKLAIDPASVKAVFFTHIDSDHSKGALLFSKAVYILPEMEVLMINGTTKRRLMGMEMKAKFDLPYQVIKDGAVTNIGAISIKALLTPGHTSGSTCYIVNKTLLFTGDLLLLEKGKAQVTWSFMNNNTEQSLQSLKKLAHEISGVKILLSSHSGVTSNLNEAFGALQ